MASEKFINAINRKAQTVPPIWMMRQAGRYHKHYQALRAKHSFMDLCKNAELAAEVALGPVAEFDFDVSILFSDLLFPLEALGMGLEYTDAGPKLGWHLNPQNFVNLKSPKDALEGLLFQKDAMKLTRERIPKDKSVIGFVGGPWTLFVYAVEGSHKGSLVESKRYLSLFPKFCQIMVPLLIENIRLQFEGGAEVVMIFDTAAGELDPYLFKNLVAPSLAQMAASFPKRMGYYSKGTMMDHYETPHLQSDVWAGRGFDHRWAIEKNLKSFSTGFVQGNFDQSLLHADSSEFEKLLREYLKPILAGGIDSRTGWVCGLGHGVLPKTPEKNVKRFVEVVRELCS